MMSHRQYFVLEIIERVVLPLKNILPRKVNAHLQNEVKKLFESAAIQSYLSDQNDIGFFEGFILGSDETKRFSQDIVSALQSCKKADFVAKTSGYMTTDYHDLRQDEDEIIRQCILSKKQMVVDILKRKGEIITYLGRRINTTSEVLYQKLERLHREFSTDCAE